MKLSTSNKSMCFSQQILRQHVKTKLRGSQTGNGCTLAASTATQHKTEKLFWISCMKPHTNSQAQKISLLSHFTGLAILLPGSCHPKPSVISRSSHWAVCSGAASPPKHCRLSVHKTNVTKHRTGSFPQHPFYLILNMKAYSLQVFLS